MADTFLTEALTQQKKIKNKEISLSPQRESLSPPPGKAQESQVEKLKRQWDWILRKIQFNPPTEDYYARSIFKPGVFFYKALAQSRFNTDMLHINIPESIMCFDSNNYLMYTDESTGQVKRKQDISYSDFEQKINDYNDKFIERFSQHRSFDKRLDLKSNTEGPYIICRGQTVQDWNMSKSVITSRQQKERKVAIDNNKIEQRFLYSRAMKATILRLVYNTKNSQTTSANYAWRIMNYRELLDPNPKKSITNKTTINTEEQNSFQIQLVKGTGLMDYERQCEQVIAFLERSYPVRIRRAVLDFIQDIEGVNWVINLKYINMDSAVSMSQIQGTGEGKKTLDQLTCSVYCKLCGIIFKKDDASKVLTYKLLWELVQHLKKRNKKLTNIKVSHSSTRPCRVCDMCYMLVVGEHELVEVEQKFALAQNIPIGDAIIRVPMESKPKHRPALLAENLYQWRFLIFAKSLSDLKGNNVNDLSNLFVQYKLHNIRTCFKTQSNNKNINTLEPTINRQRPQASAQSFKSSFFNPSSEKSLKQLRFSGQNRSNSAKELQEQNLKSQPLHDQNQIYDQDLNVIRVHYFFSETMDIDKFLNETEIKVRLTTGSEWNNYNAEGSTKTIHHFKNKIQGGQRHSAQILLFFENSQYCILNLQAGLFCDGIYNTSKLNLYKYNNIYFPDENYYNCNPFPAEWMEMFDPQSVCDRDSFNEKAKEIEAYSPKCTKDELNKMIDFNKYSEKNKYRNVDSIVMQRIRDVKSATGVGQQKEISSRMIPINSNRTMPLFSAGNKNQQGQKKYEIDEQFLLQHYTVEENELEADEIIFREEKQFDKKNKKNEPILSDGSEEDQELEMRLNQEIEKAHKAKKSNSTFQIRQTQSAQQLPPRPVINIERPKQSAQIVKKNKELV